MIGDCAMSTGDGDRNRPRLSGATGASAATVVILTPLMLVLVMFVVFAGRLTTTRQDVLSASRDAARSAAVRSPSNAVAAGDSAARSTLADRSVSCSGGLTVTVATGAMTPGGQVTATVTCVVVGSDLLPFWAPGSRTISETSVAPVDRYREG